MSASRARNWLADDGVPIALLFIVCAAFACTIPAQSDTFYHLRSGQAMWESRWFLNREVFSHTAYGQPLPNHWWLSQLIFIGLYALGGPVLLTVTVGACALFAVLLSWRLTRGSMEIRLALLLVLMLTLPQWSVRPQAFSLLLLMLVIRLVLADRLPWVLPVLVLWANMHAVVIFGVAVVCAAAAEAVIWSRHRTRLAVLCTVAAFVAPMISPLGFGFWPWLFDTVNDARRLGLQEYGAAATFGLTALPFWVVLAWFMIAVMRALPTLQSRDRHDRVLVIATAALAAAAVTSQRNIAFFALVAAPTLSRLAAPARIRPSRPAAFPAYALVVVAVVLAVAFVAYQWRNGGSQLGWKPFRPEAIAAIRACPSPIYNSFGDGGTFMWFVREHRVFMDGRTDVYPVDFLLRGRRADLAGDYKGLFEIYGIRCAVVRSGSPMDVALGADRSMTKQFSDAQWSIWVRSVRK